MSHYRKQVSIAGACLILVSSLAITVNGNNRSVLKVDPPNIDLGKRALGEIAKETVKIINGGSEDIDLLKVIAQCGCIKAEPEAWIIKAGQSIKLSISVDSLGREGKFSKSLILLTSSSERPIRINIKGEFLATDHHLVSNPYLVYFGKHNINDSDIGQVVKITRRGRIPVGPIKVSSTANWCTADIMPERSSDRKVYLRILLRVPRNVYKVDKEVIVRGPERDDFIRIPVRATIARPIRLVPKMVYVVHGKNRYKISIETYDGKIPRLEKYTFKRNGLILMSCNAYPKKLNHLILEVFRQQGYMRFASGKLLLHYEGVVEPIEIMFVSPPLSLQRIE